MLNMTHVTITHAYHLMSHLCMAGLASIFIHSIHLTPHVIHRNIPKLLIFFVFAYRHATLHTMCPNLCHLCVPFPCMANEDQQRASRTDASSILCGSIHTDQNRDGDMRVNQRAMDERRILQSLATLLPPSVHAHLCTFLSSLPILFPPPTPSLPDSLTVRTASMALDRLILTPIDKNANQLALMCPAHYYHQLTATYAQDPHYAPAHKSAQQIIQLFKLTHDTYQPLGISKWNQRVKGLSKKRKRHKQPVCEMDELEARQLLPYAYILPKHKDLKHKTRPIVSYACHPLRPMLQLLSRALTFLLLSLPDSIHHYTLWRTRDVCALIREFLASTRHTYAGQSYALLSCCSDIKNMFTELAHEHIINSCQWLIHTACEQHGIRSSRARRNAAALVMELKPHGSVHWSPS